MRHHGAVDVAVGLTVMVAVVLLVTAATRRLGLSSPLILMVVGAIASFVPLIPEVRLGPEVVLLGILPPLLYGTAIQTSAIDFKHNLRPIGLLSVLLVAVTAGVVGLVVWLLLPVPFTVAFALGAVVAPPDAVAAAAIARRVGLPRRVVAILSGESLVNDATAITCLRIGMVAMAGAIGALEIAGSFLLAAGGAIVIGAVVALVFARIRRHIIHPVVDTACSLLIPFVAYLPAEAVHASGVVAVVVAGIVLGHRAPALQSAESRVNENVNWRTVLFLLENTVFLLIGLQSRWIVGDVLGSDLRPGHALLVALTVLVTVIVVRMVWVSAIRYLLRPGGRLSWAETVVVGWAGMRGVVTLAAAFLLPASTPYREVVEFTALVVTAGTLLLQGLTLGPLAQRLGAHGPDARQDALQLAQILQDLGNRSLERLGALDGSTEAKRAVADRIRTRSNAVWERLGQQIDIPAEEYRRLRLVTLDAERSDLLEWRRRADVDQDVITEVLHNLDIEESMLQRVSASLQPVEETPLSGDATPLLACPDLAAASDLDRPTDAECAACREEGLNPVHLRMCLACGEIGCCDSSVGRHATAHFRDSGHPVMRSIEPGEQWRWCFLHNQLG